MTNPYAYVIYHFKPHFSLTLFTKKEEKKEQKRKIDRKRWREWQERRKRGKEEEREKDRLSGCSNQTVQRPHSTYIHEAQPQLDIILNIPCPSPVFRYIKRSSAPLFLTSLLKCPFPLVVIAVFVSTTSY